MCRNIHTLYNFEPSATEEEVRDAALQYVRKISGFTKPSIANADAFERAVIGPDYRATLDEMIPGGFDQAVALKALQGRIDLADVERPDLAGAAHKFLPKLEPVLRPLAEQRQQRVSHRHLEPPS